MAALSQCPSCGSELVQPLRWQQRKAGDVLVELRCPECFTVMQACHTAAEMEDLDRLQSEWRDLIVSAYERSVAENMEALAESLREGLERDLLGPDDFAPRPRPRGRPGEGPGLPRAA